MAKKASRMDLEEKLDLLTRTPIEEVVKRAELRELLETKNKPVAYDGFEPSGMAHIGSGVNKALLVKRYVEAGAHYKILLADWHGWINNKMGGDLEALKSVGEYFEKVFETLGVDTKKVEMVWASDLAASADYWAKVIRIAKNTTTARTNRCLTIMGRKEGELKEVAQYFYPMMQCADIFELDADICQLGIDQRKVNMLAREVGPKLGWWKPVVCSHHMLMGLQGPTKMGGYDEKYDAEISSKMSKSKPDTCVYVHDSLEQIHQKLRNAFCPEKQTEGNPVVELARYIVLEWFGKLEISRAEKFGGDVEYTDYKSLASDFSTGKLHPLDLKKGVAIAINQIIAPCREYFQKNPEYMEVFKKNKITR